MPGIHQVEDEIDRVIVMANKADRELQQFYENKLVNTHVIEAIGSKDIIEIIGTTEKVLQYFKQKNRTKKLVIPLKRISKCK